MVIIFMDVMDAVGRRAFHLKGVFLTEKRNNMKVMDDIEYEYINAKKVPMKKWKAVFTSKELALIEICIAESLMLVLVTKDIRKMKTPEIKILKDKSDLADKILRIMKIDFKRDTRIDKNFDELLGDKK